MADYSQDLRSLAVTLELNHLEGACDKAKLAEDDLRNLPNRSADANRQIGALTEARGLAAHILGYVEEAGYTASPSELEDDYGKGISRMPEGSISTASERSDGTPAQKEPKKGSSTSYGLGPRHQSKTRPGRLYAERQQGVALEELRTTIRDMTALLEASIARVEQCLQAHMP